MKTFGVSQWEGDSLKKNFQYIKTIPFKKVSRLYHPWHIDFFIANDQYGKKKSYAVVQTDEKFADILLAIQSDNLFHLFSKPLITNKTIGMIGIYKPTAVVIGDTFYLYYTARDNEDNSLNRLFVTSSNWKELLYRLDN